MSKKNHSLSTRPKSVLRVDDPSELVTDCSQRLWTLRSDKQSLQNTISKLTIKKRNLARAIEAAQQDMIKIRLASNQHQEQTRMQNKLLRHRIEQHYSQKKELQKLRLDIVELGEAKMEVQVNNEMILELVQEEQRAIERQQNKKNALIREKTIQVNELRQVRSHARISQKKQNHINYRLSLQKKQNNSMLLNLRQNE